MKKYFTLLVLLFLSQLHFAQQKPNWEISEHWDGLLEDWRKSSAIEMIYDDQDRLIQRNFYTWSQAEDNWISQNTLRYEYNNAGLLSSYKRDYLYDFNTQIFNSSDYNFYEYNSADQLILSKRQWINNVDEIILNESTFSYHYDENDCLFEQNLNDRKFKTSVCNAEGIIVIDSVYYGGQEVVELRQYAYDEFGNQKLTTFFDWDANANQAHYTETQFQINDDLGKYWYTDIIQVEDYMDHDMQTILDDEGRLINARFQVFDKNTNAIYDEALLERNFAEQKISNEFIQVKDRNRNVIYEREIRYSYDENDYLSTEQSIVTQFSPNAGGAPYIVQYEYNCEGLVSSYIRRSRINDAFISTNRVSYIYDNLVHCDEISTSQLTLFPNPTNGIFSVLDLSLNDSDMMLRIFDVKGVLIKQENTSCQGGRLEFDASDLPNGFYFVNINNGEINKTEKLLIAK